jgi:hypothetical protein
MANVDTPWSQSRLLADAQGRRHLKPGMNWAMLVEQPRPIAGWRHSEHERGVGEWRLVASGQIGSDGV